MKSDRTFNFDYEWKKRCQCGAEIKNAYSDDWATIKSPDYPTPYCNNMNCTWLIQAPPQHRIVINITDFLTEIDQDFLVIFEGNSTNSSHLAFLSGMEQSENLIASKSNQMTIVFISDLSLSLRGFSLDFKAG
uniref:CUB domain-containing protein n=1 Tax=Panagrolaimus superbus TaxID=310955 RepID=A0A914YSS3_9BILA